MRATVVGASLRVMTHAAQPIVVGSDGSPTASRALAKAGELALALGAPVHVVTCYSPGATGAALAAAGGMAIDPTGLEREARLVAEEVVGRSRAWLERLQVPAHGHVCSGDPAAALITVAEDLGAQMIVVGNRGMTGTRRILGSVPNRLSHHASCSVLIVATQSSREARLLSGEVAAPTGAT